MRRKCLENLLKCEIWEGIRSGKLLCRDNGGKRSGGGNMKEHSILPIEKSFFLSSISSVEATKRLENISPGRRSLCFWQVAKTTKWTRQSIRVVHGPLVELFDNITAATHQNQFCKVLLDENSINLWPGNLFLFALRRHSFGVIINDNKTKRWGRTSEWTLPDNKKFAAEFVVKYLLFLFYDSSASASFFLYLLNCDKIF